MEEIKSYNDIKKRIEQSKNFKEYKEIDNCDTLVKDAEWLAKNCNINATQLRKIFDEIKGLLKSERRLQKLNLLRPKLAYTKGRGLIDDKLYVILNACIDKLNKANDDDCEAFKLFMESLVGYHKFYSTRGDLR